MSSHLSQTNPIIGQECWYLMILQTSNSMFNASTSNITCFYNSVWYEYDNYGPVCWISWFLVVRLQIATIPHLTLSMAAAKNTKDPL